jgi:hypothetical protein
LRAIPQTIGFVVRDSSKCAVSLVGFAHFTDGRETVTAANELRGAASIDMKFEVAVIPASDVDRAKRFYAGLGWRLDADYVRIDG